MANVPGLVTDPSRIKGGVISLPSGGGQIAAYLAYPNQPGNHPGIVVIQEAFGLDDHICDLTRRFANIGYNAVALPIALLGLLDVQPCVRFAENGRVIPARNIHGEHPAGTLHERIG